MIRSLVLFGMAVCLCLALRPAAWAGELHRVFNLGGMEVIALADVPPGSMTENKPELLAGLSDAEKRALPPGIMAGSINCFIVRMGGDIVLFDTGLGGERGLLVQAMAGAGIRPEDVTVVVITHFHGDHVGGLVNGNGEAVFPKALLKVPRIEFEAKVSVAMKFMEAYAGRLHMFEWDHPATNGVTAIDAKGHTPGHTAYLVQVGGQRLLILGDLIHFPGVQFPRPEVAVSYDEAGPTAVESRLRIFDYAAKEGMPVAGMHLVFPGIGTIAKSGAGYAFTPQK